MLCHERINALGIVTVNTAVNGMKNDLSLLMLRIKDKQQGISNNRMKNDNG